MGFVVGLIRWFALRGPVQVLHQSQVMFNGRSSLVVEVCFRFGFTARTWPPVLVVVRGSSPLGLLAWPSHRGTAMLRGVVVVAFRCKAACESPSFLYVAACLRLLLRVFHGVLAVTCSVVSADIMPVCRELHFGGGLSFRCPGEQASVVYRDLAVRCFRVGYVESHGHAMLYNSLCVLVFIFFLSSRMGSRVRPTWWLSVFSRQKFYSVFCRIFSCGIL